MMWKKFTDSLILVFVAVSAMACWNPSVGGKQIYMFKTYNLEDRGWWWNDGTHDKNIKFWLSYTNGEVDSLSIEKALYECPVEAIDNGTNTFFNYLHRVGDSDALRYWTISKTYLKKIDDPWYYPNSAEKKDLESLVKEVVQIRTSCQSPKLKERFLMMTMRIAFYLKQYDICIDLWEKNADPWNDKDIKRKCHLYYAGALFYSGSETKAACIYADNKDWTSLRYFGTNTDFLNKLFSDYPHSKAFNYFVQNYLNQYQDVMATTDCSDFVSLCEKAASSKRTGNPALWQSALAHVAFLKGDLDNAIKLIEKASTMKGDAITMENIRMLRLLYHAANTDDAQYDNYLYRDLPWLLKKVAALEDGFWASNNGGYDHYLNMLWRVVIQYAAPRYSAKGNHNLAAAVLNTFDEVYCYDRKLRAALRNDTNAGSMEYSTNYFAYLDNASIDDVKNFLAFVKSGGKTNLEKALVKNGFVSESMINELIGTKYMRIHDYQSAIQYFSKVSDKFWKKQNITPYLGRNPFKENWIGNEKLRCRSYGTFNPAYSYDTMPTKVQYCRLMLDMEKRIKNASDKEECAALNYAYAVGLYQSEDWCWALTQYAQGTLWCSIDVAINLLQFQSKWRFNNERNCDSWDYRSSSYFQQQQYKKVYSHLDAAERLTQDAELLARCLYMRAAVDTDIPHESLNIANLLRKCGKTKFITSERPHCDVLNQNYWMGYYSAE